jgi:diamine N-acetyltransferase
MIELRPITPQNHVEARKLAVRQDQQRFIASVDSSLADAFVWDSIFRVAFEDGVPVGFILLFPFERDRKRLVNVVRLMVDSRYQGRGLGRELLSASLGYLTTFTHRVDIVRISTLPDNEVALALYKGSGFEERGIESGEVALYLEIGG